MFGGVCMLKASNIYIYISICNTKQYIFQTKYAVLRHSRTYNNVRGSIPRLATWISEIGYLLLPSRDMAEIPLMRRKSPIQLTNQLIATYTLVSGVVHVFNKIIYMDSIQQALQAQSVEHQNLKLRVVGSSPTVDKKFSFYILSLSTRSWQVHWFHANEIKHDVHTMYIGA